MASFRYRLYIERDALDAQALVITTIYFLSALAMDIDDILADLDADSVPQEHQDLQQLTRTWIAERCAPELLPYPSELMDRVLSRISKQIETIEEATGNMDPKTNFTLIILQTELERFKFLIRSLLRARLSKIDAHPLYHNTLDTKDNILSHSEMQYLQHHQALLSHHYSASFLGSFPPALQRLDDTAGGISMVDRPDVEKAVFVRVLRDCGEVGVPGTDVRAEFKRGDVWVLRWSAVREKVLDGDVEVM
jgi:GINS complex subunit 4